MAIGYDSSQMIGENSASSTDDTITVPTLSSGIAFVGIEGDTLLDDISSVTLGGQTMTQANKGKGSTTRYGYLYYLINPPSGSQHLIITFLSSHIIGRVISYYTGAKQSSQPDNSAFNSAVASSVTGTLTTIADNCWTVAYGFAQNGAVGAGTGTTQRQSANGFGIFDSNGAITPAGSTSLQITCTTSGSIIMASFSPNIASGPSNLKSLDTNVKSNIKTYNTNTLANIKSINTNT